MTIGCCGCCTACRPRYKTLVDNIYPPNPEDGVIKSNVDKLTYYAMSTPDKLDRIGDYLAHRLNRDVHRRRTGYVIITMDVLDQLLVTCHANSINLFVESFLQMVQKLLESTEPQLQLRATQSFEKFANIGEDTPSYHRRYDFLVSKFSSMCYSNCEDNFVQKQLRIAGIKGLQGVIRKTDCDNLGENIWLPQHMDKIVPALLFNLHEKKMNVQGVTGRFEVQENQPEGEKEPHELAEMCLRELGSRATYGKISTVIKPLLVYLDTEQMWINSDFAVQTFKLLMYSIQVQYSITVIEQLMAHLNEKGSSPPQYRTGIAYVLSKIIPIAAGECIGPSAIDIINSLLEHIRSSVVGEAQSSEVSAEATYQEALIHALGEYASHLPDYQKIDSMVFILNKVPGSDRIDDGGAPRPDGEVKLQHLLLKSLLEVGTKYTTNQYSKAFSQSFLVRLMRISVSSDPHVRLTVQHILHTLIDRHNNTSKLAKPTLDVNNLGLTVSKPVRQDINFWLKSGNEILLSIQENCEFTNNSVANIEAVYTTLMLLLTEIRCDDVVVDTLRVLFHIQTVAQRPGLLSPSREQQIHGLVAAVMVAISHCVSALKEHVSHIIRVRSEEAVYLLPESSSNYTVAVTNEKFLFDHSIILGILKASNLDERRLNTNIPSMMRRPSTIHHQPTTSTTDITVEVESAASSPGIPRKTFEEEVTFESLKKVLNDSPEQERKLEEERRREMTHAFMTESFDVLVAKVHARQPDTLQTKLSEIFSRLPPPTCPPTAGTTTSPGVYDPSYVSPTAPYQFPYTDIYIY